MNSRQSDVVPSTSASISSAENVKEQAINSGASTQKVSEVFLAAGQAFQKLGGLIANLHNPRNGIERETNRTLAVDQRREKWCFKLRNSRKWTSSDTTSLHDAVSRFASDLQRISETVQGREVQLMKDDIIKRPTTSHYIKTVPSRTNGAPARPTSTARSVVKRTNSVPHPSLDTNFKRRIISAAPSGITVSSNTRYANVSHVQSLNMNSSAISRIKNNGPLNVVPSALTTVTVQSNIPSVVLPPEPKMHNTGLKNFDGSVFNI